MTGVQAQALILGLGGLDMAPRSAVIGDLFGQTLEVALLLLDPLAQGVGVVVMQEMLLGVHLLEGRPLGLIQVTQVMAMGQRCIGALLGALVVVGGNGDDLATFEAPLVGLDVGLAEKDQDRHGAALAGGKGWASS